jgi:hypothetical protein
MHQEKRYTYICNNSPIIAGDFNIPLLVMGRATSKKINKETENLKHTINQLD